MVQTKLIISSFNNLRGILKGPPDLPDFKFVIIFSIKMTNHIQYIPKAGVIRLMRTCLETIELKI